MSRGPRRLGRALVGLPLVLAACELSSPAAPYDVQLTSSHDHFGLVAEGDTLLTARVLKWYGGHRAAVSITYDAPWGTHAGHHLATDAAIARGLRMDLEIVTANYLTRDRQELVAYYRDVLIPSGIHFFGHGHTHALHDTMEYEEAYTSFRTCFELMAAWGLRPRAYAYPGGSGARVSTQTANRRAGFFCARGQAFQPEEYYIVPGNLRQPPNWYYLPSVVMGNASYQYLDSHDKLAPVLDTALERTAWVILMYHAIGIPGGWSYYPLIDFAQDLNQIAGGDFWSANLDDATAYVRERDALQFILHRARRDRHGRLRLDIAFEDGLDDDLYDQPLTVELRASPGATFRRARLELAADGFVDVDLAAAHSFIEIVPDGRSLALLLE